MQTRKYNRRAVEFVSATDQATDILLLPDVKAFLRVDGTDDDALLTLLIATTVDGAEKYLRRSIRRQVLDLTMDNFPFADDDALARLGPGMHQVPPSFITGSTAEFDLPYAPATAITSITTYLTDNTPAVFSSNSYILDNSRVILNQGYTWPTSLRERAAVKVRYAAGYGPVNLPGSIRLGMMQHIVAMYECRMGCEMPMASQGLMSQYRILDGLAW